MDWDSDIHELLEDRVSEARNSVSAEQIVDDFIDVAEELEENMMLYDRRGTLKHGTAADNIESIIEEGLVSGQENDSVAGERGDQNWVRMTHPFPIAFKYGREAFPERRKVIRKANNWAQFLGRNTADWSQNIDIEDSGDREAVLNPDDDLEGPLYRELYTHLVNSIEKLELIDSGEIDTDPVVVEIPYSSADHVHVPWDENHPEELEDYREDISIEGVEQAHYPGHVVSEQGLLEMTEDELDAIDPEKGLVPDSPLQETKITSAEVEDDAVIYVPHERLQEFRDEYSGDVNVLSLDAKALQHELRMQEGYTEEGTVSYTTPWDVDSYVIKLDWEKQEYDNNPTKIDISA